ncbi:hypothetical protein ORY89_06385 [Listeria monocytogenes]|uniref:hypothetical protein n=1 Tax=Listeria TaxID=1637 RepID=UPI0019040ADB|nr:MULTISPECIES: hypothetical protein [Listeria]MBK1965122.1 hypothetical protein [Listeria ivanovii subsp. londoniensis]WDE53465.1 hypothetical protein ORY89_06385 [Listeria monocytogenes]HEM1440058.1 hypothetical protein [Listeria monocytogenes]
MTMKVYEKDRVFQGATKVGWMAAQGTQITISGIDFAFCPVRRNKSLTIDVFEVSSGALMASVPIDIVDIYICDTRDTAIEFYKNEIAPVVVSKINKFGIKKVKSAIEILKKQMTNDFGERPKIVDLEEENNEI